MAYDEKVADRMRRILAGRVNVVEKRMFGGVCFMVSGHMCCGLTESALVVRVGRDGYGDALARPDARPMDFTGRPLVGMVYVDPRGYETTRALERWIELGLRFVDSLPPRDAAAAKPRKRASNRVRSRGRGRA